MNRVMVTVNSDIEATDITRMTEGRVEKGGMRGGSGVPGKRTSTAGEGKGDKGATTDIDEIVVVTDITGSGIEATLNTTSTLVCSAG